MLPGLLTRKGMVKSRQLLTTCFASSILVTAMMLVSNTCCARYPQVDTAHNTDVIFPLYLAFISEIANAL